MLRPLSTSCAEQAGMDCGKAATDVMSRPESRSDEGGALRAAGVAPAVARTVAPLPHFMPILVNAVGWDNGVVNLRTDFNVTEVGSASQPRRSQGSGRHACLTIKTVIRFW